MLAGERIERANVTRRSETTLNDDLRASIFALKCARGSTLFNSRPVHDVINRALGVVVLEMRRYP